MVKKILVVAVTTVLVIHIYFLSISLFIQPPHWNPENRGSALTETLSLDAAYRTDVAGIFFGAAVSLLLLASYLLLLMRERSLYGAVLAASTAIGMTVFGFLSTRGHQWYFQFANTEPMSRFTMLALIAFMFTTVFAINRSGTSTTEAQRALQDE